MLPVAAEYEKILLVEPAVADGLTGADSNRYVFKTSRNSSMDMQAQALALKPDENLYVATLAEDYAFGRDGIAAFKAALEGTGATIRRRGIRAAADDRLHRRRSSACSTRCATRKAARSSSIYVAGIDADGAARLGRSGRYDIELSTGGNILPVLAAYKQVPGMEGAIYYYYEAPENAVNDWLVDEHQKRFNAPPDFFTAGGMASALAIVKALETAETGTPRR